MKAVACEEPRKEKLQVTSFDAAVMRFDWRVDPQACMSITGSKIWEVGDGR